jgi:general secretion pathway protein F/type IV pilus assembly protein PilC
MITPHIYWCRYLNTGGQLRQTVSPLAVGDEDTARALLEQRLDATVVHLWRLPALVGTLWRLLTPLFRKPWPVDQLSELFHNLGLMLKSGLPIDSALRELANDMEHTGIRRFLLAAHASVSAGNPLSVLLAQYEHQIPPAVRALVGIGELSGDLDRALTEGGLHIKRMKRIRQDISKALIYPLFAFATLLAAVLFWIYYVLPELSQMFLQMGAKLPSYTLATMAVIRSLQEHMVAGFWFAGSAVFIFLALLSYNQSVRYRVFWLLYRLPISGVLIKSAAMAFMTEYLALLIRAGLPLTQALKILTDNVKNPFYAVRLEQIREGVNRGNPLSQELARAQVFPAMVVRLVSVGEQTGTLEQQLTTLAEDHRQRLEHVIASLNELLKPLLILIAGVFFVLVVVVFLLPVYQLVSQVMNA